MHETSTMCTTSKCTIHFMHYSKGGNFNSISQHVNVVQEIRNYIYQPNIHEKYNISHVHRRNYLLQLKVSSVQHHGVTVLFHNKHNKACSTNHPWIQIWHHHTKMHNQQEEHIVDTQFGTSTIRINHQSFWIPNYLK